MVPNYILAGKLNQQCEKALCSDLHPEPRNKGCETGMHPRFGVSLLRTIQRRQFIYQVQKTQRKLWENMVRIYSQSSGLTRVARSQLIFYNKGLKPQPKKFMRTLKKMEILFRFFFPQSSHGFVYLFIYYLLISAIHLSPRSLSQSLMSIL